MFVRLRLVRLSVVFALMGSMLSFAIAPASASISIPGTPVITEVFSFGDYTYINFTPGDSGGSSVLNHTVTARTAAGVTSIPALTLNNSQATWQIEIRGLAPETSYTFTVTANNGQFDSNVSVRSEPITTSPDEGWYLCATGERTPDQTLHPLSYRLDELASVVANNGCTGAVTIRPGTLGIEDGFIGSSITSVTIPESVELLNNAFRDSTQLAQVTFLGNSNLSAVGQSSFEGTNLNTITIPNGVDEIGNFTFRDASQLTNVNFAENSQLELLGDGSFEGTNLNTITIPSTVTDIGEYAFRDASQLTHVNFANNSQLDFIDYGAFQGTRLNTITIPAGVSQIEPGAFKGTASLSSIEVAVANQTFRSVDGVLFRGDEDALYALHKYPQAKLGFSYTMPDGLERISTDAFANTSLRFINIPLTVDVIGFEAFKNTDLVAYNFCNNLTVLTGTSLVPGRKVCTANPISGESLYRNWQIPLTTITNGPKVGDVIYASAFERELPRSLFKQNSINGNYQTDSASYPTPEEYAYRITKLPNEPATSVDHQALDTYESLSSAEQSQWYVDAGLGGPSYEFSWNAFMCVSYPNSVLAVTKPTGLKYSYASREDGLLSNGSFNSAHNMMFKSAAQDWISRGAVQTTLSAVGTKHNNGPYTEAFLGDSDGMFYSYAWGLLDVSAICGAGQTLKALRILQSQNTPITTKNLEITDKFTLRDEASNTISNVSAEGITIGVTGGGGANEYNAALWGLATVGDIIPTSARTTNPTSPTITAPAAAVTKSTSNLGKSMRFSTSSKVLTHAHKNALKKSVKASGIDATYVVTGMAGFLPGVTEAQVKKLARMRANTVRAYLVRLGVNKANITITIKTTNQGIVPKTKILARFLAS